MKPIIDWNYDDRTYQINYFKNIPVFIDMTEEEKLRYAVVHGQIFYGFHRYIPEPCTYITFMRHPYQRLISQFFYVNVRKERLGQKHVDITMEAYLDYEPFQACTQLNLIAGASTIDEALYREPTDDTLAQAKKNIEHHFAVVGDLSHYDESLLLMKRHFNWRRTFYARVNVNQGHPKFADFDPATQRLIERVCEPELELYTYAQKRLQQQLEQQDDTFREELSRLKRQNKRFSRLYQLAAPVRHTRIWFLARSVARKIGRL